MRRIIAAAAIAAFTLTQSGALRAETPPNILVVADAIDDIVTLDPAEVFEFSGSDYVNNVYDTLFVFDPNDLDAGFQLGLAESYSLAEDGKTYTFKIREGVTFHSGNPVTAEDVVFSFVRAVKLNKTPSFILTQFGFTAENVEDKIKVAGANEVTMELDQAYAPSFFLNCLTASVASIVDKKLALEHEQDGDFGYEWLKTNSAGSGAFKLAAWKPSEAYILERPGDEDGYWRGNVAMQRVVVRNVPEPASQRLLLLNGDADIARKLQPDDIAAIAGNTEVRVETDLKGRIYYLGLNQKNEFLSKPKVLEAMKYLVDYKGMEATLLKGQYVQHQTFLPLTFLGALDKNPYTLDVARAKELLAEAGVPDGFKVTMDTRTVSPVIEMAQSIQATMAQAGIEIEILPGDGKQTLTKYRARQHDIYIGAWGPDYPDPHTNADTFTSNADNRDEAKLTGKLAWRNSWDIPDLTKLTEAAVLENDAGKRVEMYHELQAQVLERGPFVLMFQQILQNALRENVTGLNTGGPITAAYYWTVTK